MRADRKNGTDSVHTRLLMKYVSESAIFAVYWLLFAWANSMVVYYRQSIYPLLTATATPNPYVAIYTDSPLAFYNSGVEWAPSAHILLVFLFGNTFFSILLPILLVVNLNYAYISFRRGKLREGAAGIIVPIMLFVTLMTSFSPLAALPLLSLSNSPITRPLQIWVSGYGPLSNLAASAVFLLLLPLWRQLLRRSAANGTQASPSD